MWEQVRNWVKSQPNIHRAALWLLRMFGVFAGLRDIAALWRYPFFVRDWLRFRRLGGRAAVLDFYPCLHDRTATTGVDSHYFHQAIWGFKRIQSNLPESHVDVGSDVRWVGMLTCVTRVCFIDIRPLSIQLDNYESKEGSIVALPFPDRSLSSVSSLHVIEHIGLGRYGDPIDPEGSAKAGAELMRVLAPGGRLYISMPIGNARVQFNGQRVFSVADVLALFPGLGLVELSIVDTLGKFHASVSPEAIRLGQGQGLDYGLGMFIFSGPNKI